MWANVRLLWNDHYGRIRREPLERGKTYRIGRDPYSDTYDLVLLEEKRGRIIPMDIKDAPYVSRIDPEREKYGSIVIEYEEDGRIKLSRGKNSTFPVRAFLIDNTGKLINPDGVSLPMESENKYTPEKNVHGIVLTIELTLTDEHNIPRSREYKRIANLLLEPTEIKTRTNAF